MKLDFKRIEFYFGTRNEAQYKFYTCFYLKTINHVEICSPLKWENVEWLTFCHI